MLNYGFIIFYHVSGDDEYNCWGIFKVCNATLMLSYIGHQRRTENISWVLPYTPKKVKLEKIRPEFLGWSAYRLMKHILMSHWMLQDLQACIIFSIWLHGTVSLTWSMLHELKPLHALLQGSRPFQALLQLKLKTIICGQVCLSCLSPQIISLSPSTGTGTVFTQVREHYCFFVTQHIWSWNIWNTVEKENAITFELPRICFV